MFSAAELPMLIRAMMMVMLSEKRIELMGIGVPMTTICSNSYEHDIRVWLMNTFYH